MNSMKIFENDFMTVEFVDNQGSIVLVNWNATTETFNNQSFKNCFTEYKENVLAEYEPVGILHDVMNFNFPITIELQEWVDNEINKYAVSLGTKYIGFVMPADIIVQLSVEQTMDESDKPLDIRYFDNLEAAKLWITNSVN